MKLPLLMGAILLSVIAGWTFWRSRRIPNWITVPGFAVGVMLSTYWGGWSGLKNSLLGTGLAFALLLPFWLLRSLGAGDLKFAVALGAYTGPGRLIEILIGSVFVAGVMALENRRLKVENRTYQTNLESLIKARTDQLETALQELERSYDITLEALGDALNLKNAETYRHSRRVTLFTIAIARAMGVPREQIKVIARGAFLHDMGKMAIPNNLLNKPGKLDPDEVETMKGHAYQGYQILKKIPFLAEASDIVYSHQEWYDGTGYPRQLRGLEIPLGARIVAIANALDSITSDRPYRPAQPLKAAREEIQRFSGTQFDPEIVRVFLEMPDKVWEDLRREVGC